MNGWLGVVSRVHAERGAREGIAQVCHGKAAPLRRLKPGDVQDRLDLCASAHWGMALRRGLLPLSGRDLSNLARALEVKWGRYAG